MSESGSTKTSQGALSLSKGQVAFFVALSLTGVLLAMGITGTHWPRWLLVITNIL
jgi:uncharacterized protein (UPF0333 family)